MPDHMRRGVLTGAGRLLLLAGASVGLAGLTGGCLSAAPGADPEPTTASRTASSTTPPEKPPSTANSERADYDAYTWNGGDPLDRLGTDFPEGAAANDYVALLRSNTEAAALEDAISLRDEARAFLGATDFESHAVVFYRDGHSSSTPDLVIDAVERTNGGVELRARSPGGARTDDIVADNLFVRVARGGAEFSPRYATVTLGAEDAGTTLSTVSTDGKFGLARREDPVDLYVRNLDCTTHQVGISATVRGELQFGDTVEVPSGSVAIVADALALAATYELEASLGEETVAGTLDLSDGPAAVAVEVGADGALVGVERVERVASVERCADSKFSSGFDRPGVDPRHDRTGPVTVSRRNSFLRR